MTDTYYKAVRVSDHTSWHDGKTLWEAGQTVTEPRANTWSRKACGRGLHCSPTLLDAVSYQNGSSDYCVVRPTGEPLGSNAKKSRFRELEVVRFLEQSEIDELAGFRLWEANHPVNPFLIEPTITIEEAVATLSQSETLRASRWNSVWESVGNSVGTAVRTNVWDAVWDGVGDIVCSRVLSSAGIPWPSNDGDRIRYSACAYFGGLFPNIDSWKYVEARGPDPWRPLLTLWYAGYVPSVDSHRWRLHCGPNAEVVWEGKP